MPDVTDCGICDLLANCGNVLRVDDRVDFQTLMLRLLCQISENTLGGGGGGGVPASRRIDTTFPLQGGGDFSIDRTHTIADAVADGVGKGASTYTAADFNSAAGVISIDYTNGQAASAGAKGFLTSADWSTFNSKESALTFSTPLSRSVNTVSINDAAADGATKGASTYTAADFNSAAGVISIDYTNGQAASAGAKGFLTSADWTTFNSKYGSGASPIFVTVTQTGTKKNYVTKTANYTATAIDDTIDCTSNTFTVSLPASSGIGGTVYTIKNSGAGVITVDPNASETIDGATTYEIHTTNSGIIIQSDNTNWKVIGIF